MEQAIMAENSQWFVLANNLPLLRKDIVEKIGFKGEKEVSSLLISQEVMVRGVSLDLAGFLKLLYQLSQYYINYLITRAQWSTHWKKCKEKTSSSKSGLYYNHYLV